MFAIKKFMFSCNKFPSLMFLKVNKFIFVTIKVCKTKSFHPKSMKKLLIAIIALGLYALAMTACSSSTDCPAYGEVHKYQIEQRY
jgi:hypothetical protein